MKKTLALVLALAMVFSTITVAFAEGTIGADAQVCADLGMLKGATGTVDAAYVATAPTRIQAAVMFLRLKGLEAEAMAFTGAANFADADKAAWATPVMAYLKANPQLGWMGDGTNFDPMGLTTAQAYYKVMLEALGYKQTTAEVVGDFAYADVMTFAASKGLTKVAAVTNFTVNDLATATVEALKANMKDGGKTLVATLVEAGKVDNAKAVTAGLIVEAPAAVTAVVDDVTSVGNTVVEVTFEDDVDAAVAGNVANYAIEGLTINAAVVADTDIVRLETAAMTAGKLYTLTFGGKSVKFTAVAKVSGAPEIEKVVSEDIEEVVITFTKNIDLATGSNVANYSIAGVEIAKAEVDEDEVTLTTVGLKNKTKYTVKVTNVKSVDGTTKKSDSDSFTSKFDTAAPKIAANGVVAETNNRLKVTFNEEVTEESAENLANYAVKVDEKDGAALEIISVEWDSDDEDFVFVTTETMEKNEDYVLTVNSIVDQRKAANTMSRPSSADFKGKAEDEKAPKLDSAKAPAPNKILVTFKDESRIDEASATDLNNYDLEDLSIDEIAVVQDDYQIFRVMLTVEDMETGKSYDLTVEGVEDEFANAMAEDKEAVRATQTSIASVKVNSAVATGENTILVVFSDEVDEDSAENIANYEVDEDLGAPTKAEFEKTNAPANSVTLTVNDMINGYDDYDLTIDGVLDLAGNKLFYEPVVNTTTNKWDTSEPEIEDVEALNNKIVALTFDEKVKFETGAKLVLAINNNDANTIVLTANDYDEDDTVVEFAYANTLTESVEFSVYKIVYNNVYTSNTDVDGGIKDLIGNPILVTDIVRTDYAFNGNDSAPEGMEFDSYTQLDGKTFEVVFPRDVVIKAGSQNGFNVTYKSATNNYTVRLKKATGLIEEDTDYTFNFSTLFTDKHNIAVAEIDENDTDDAPDVVILTGEYKDEDAPYINEVAASNRLEIEVKFNERIDELTIDIADFELRNYDLDEAVTITGLDDITDNDGTVILKVTKPLEARYEYSLTIKAKDKVADVAGINNDSADTFYFDGSNLQP